MDVNDEVAKTFASVLFLDMNYFEGKCLSVKHFRDLFRMFRSLQREAIKKMKFHLIIMAIISVAELTDCIIIDCEFKNDFIHDWGLRYSCRTTKFIVERDAIKISNVFGTHLANLAKENVTQFFARNLNVERFPSGLGENFVDLEVVRITICHMRLLLKEDMEHLGKLKYLDLIGNKLEKLESDTFEFAPNLIEVILNNNRLLFIGSRLMDPMKKLECISFGGNVCIGSHAKHSNEQLLRLKTEINLKCNDISFTDVMTRFDEMKTNMKNLMETLVAITKELSKTKKN